MFSWYKTLVNLFTRQQRINSPKNRAMCEHSFCAFVQCKSLFLLKSVFSVTPNHKMSWNEFNFIFSLKQLTLLFLLVIKHLNNSIFILQIPFIRSKSLSHCHSSLSNMKKWLSLFQTDHLIPIQFLRKYLTPSLILLHDSFHLSIHW